MAVMKFCGLFRLKPNRRPMTREEPQDTMVRMTNMTGIMARSTSLSAVSCEASLVKAVLR